MHKYLETVAVVSIQSVLCTEPQKPLIVLSNLLNARLRQSLCSREMSEAQIGGVHNGKFDRLRIHTGLEHSSLDDNLRRALAG